VAVKVAVKVEEVKVEEVKVEEVVKPVKSHLRGLNSLAFRRSDF
jgi:hypothetical protein